MVCLKLDTLASSMALQSTSLACFPSILSYQMYDMQDTTNQTVGDSIDSGVSKLSSVVLLSRWVTMQLRKGVATSLLLGQKRMWLMLSCWLQKVHQSTHSGSHNFFHLVIHPGLVL